MRSVNVTSPEVRKSRCCWCCCESFVRAQLPEAKIGAATKIKNDGLAGVVFFAYVKFEDAFIPGARDAKILYTHDNHVERIKDSGVRTWTSAWTCSWSPAEGAPAAVSVLARWPVPVSAAITPITSMIVAAAKAAAVFATTKTTTGLRGWRRPFKFEVCGHRLAAILRNVEGNALPFSECLCTRSCESRYVYEDIRASAIRENKSEAFRFIEPLNSSSLPHC